MSDPKQLFDYFRNMLICGFLIYYGIYLFNKDTWPVHDYIGPIIALLGLTLYFINGFWGWVNIKDKLSLANKGRIIAKYIIATVYVLILITFLDAVVHFHHLSFT